MADTCWCIASFRDDPHNPKLQVARSRGWNPDRDIRMRSRRYPDDIGGNPYGKYQLIIRSSPKVVSSRRCTAQRYVQLWRSIFHKGDCVQCLSLCTSEMILVCNNL
uniref:Uncharacterized protein n=1 Tax=Araneus ventricosus TaxID=182803 RepID=A0A4Y2AIP4_ARAVE|nr:hypothetical protein AVEN_68375-1 [Araneus ventricosus]